MPFEWNHSNRFHCWHRISLHLPTVPKKHNNEIFVFRRDKKAAVTDEIRFFFPLSSQQQKEKEERKNKLGKNRECISFHLISFIRLAHCFFSFVVEVVVVLYAFECDKRLHINEFRLPLRAPHATRNILMPG